MVDKQKVIDFIQDFGFAKFEQLQFLYNDKENNFKNILSGNMVSKKGYILVHNTKRINKQMLVALDILCKYKGRFRQFHQNYEPVYIPFLTEDNIVYHIIVTDKENEKGVVKIINSSLFPKLTN